MLRFSLLYFSSWRRETLVKGVGPGGLLGDVVYVTPCGRQVWNIESVREVSSIINSLIYRSVVFFHILPSIALIHGSKHNTAA